MRRIRMAIAEQSGTAIAGQWPDADTRIDMLTVSQNENIAATTIPAALRDKGDLLAARATFDAIAADLSPETVNFEATNTARIEGHI